LSFLCIILGFGLSRDYPKLGIFERVLQHIETSYIRKIDKDKIIYGAIRGMVRSLDPHSSFMDPEEFKIFKADTKGEFCGVGIEFDIIDGILTVVTPIEGSPAYEAGIQPEDKILKINQKSTLGMSAIDVVKMVRGRPGTYVSFVISRAQKKELLYFKILRKRIWIKPVEGRLIKPGYGYLKIKTFQHHSATETRKILDKFKKLKGLILDLRNNPGGLLEEAILIADEFIPKGTIVVIKGRKEYGVKKEHAHRKGTRLGFPMVVLVNKASASAAEILAGALQDHKRAVIFGTTTFGKGSLQTMINLPDGSGLKLTIAEYYTPLGHQIHRRGIKPDIELNPAVLASLKKKDRLIDDPAIYLAYQYLQTTSIIKKKKLRP
jgi:carboxyl-terminal processing protease